MMRWGNGYNRERRAVPRGPSTILGVEVDKRDLAFALLVAPLVLVGLWVGMAYIFALVPA